MAQSAPLVTWLNSRTSWRWEKTRRWKLVDNIEIIRAPTLNEEIKDTLEPQEEPQFRYLSSVTLEDLEIAAVCPECSLDAKISVGEESSTLVGAPLMVLPEKLEIDLGGAFLRLEPTLENEVRFTWDLSLQGKDPRIYLLKGVVKIRNLGGVPFIVDNIQLLVKKDDEILHSTNRALENPLEVPVLSLTEIPFEIENLKLPEIEKGEYRLTISVHALGSEGLLSVEETFLESELPTGLPYVIRKEGVDEPHFLTMGGSFREYATWIEGRDPPEILSEWILVEGEDNLIVDRKELKFVLLESIPHITWTKVDNREEYRFQIRLDPPLPYDRSFTVLYQQTLEGNFLQREYIVPAHNENVSTFTLYYPLGIVRVLPYNFSYDLTTQTIQTKKVIV